MASILLSIVLTKSIIKLFYNILKQFFFPQRFFFKHYERLAERFLAERFLEDRRLAERFLEDRRFAERFLEDRRFAERFLEDRRFGEALGDLLPLDFLLWVASLQWPDCELRLCPGGQESLEDGEFFFRPAVAFRQRPVSLLLTFPGGQGLGDPRLEDRFLEDRFLDDRFLDDRFLDDRFLDDRFLEDRFLEDRFLEDRFLEDRFLEDRFLEDRFLEDRRLEDRFFLQRPVSLFRVCPGGHGLGERRVFLYFG
jgi:hypothetical protein